MERSPGRAGDAPPSYAGEGGGRRGSPFSIIHGELIILSGVGAAPPGGGLPLPFSLPDRLAGPPGSALFSGAGPPVPRRPDSSARDGAMLEAILAAEVALAGEALEVRYRGAPGRPGLVIVT